MNNIKSLIAALAFAGLTACADNSPKTFSGFITDASMNTVTVRALADESTCTSRPRPPTRATPTACCSAPPSP